MDTILITQLVILGISFLLIHPISPIADYIEKVFGDYTRGLIIITGGQIILIFITLLILSLSGEFISDSGYIIWF